MPGDSSRNIQSFERHGLDEKMLGGRLATVSLVATVE
jgi:hypothetical protein